MRRMKMERQWFIIYRDGSTQVVMARTRSAALRDRDKFREWERCVDLPWGDMQPTTGQS